MLAAGTTVGVYEILGPLGSGGMGDVYRARDSRLAREVALKVLPESFAHDPDRLARFHREAQVLASLNHPHIAAIYGFEDSSGIRALAMELVEGPTLEDRLKRGPISASEALPIARQIAFALEYAHDHAVIHRDLKPANIKLTADDNVKILDFGLAKALSADPSSSGDIATSPTVTRMATMPGIILGTAAYMAPEQAKGKSVDRRADVWAFGCVLYEMLAGRKAFDGETVTDVLAAIITRDPDWSALPQDTPRAIRALLARCLKKDPSQRLQAIGEARIAIDEVLSGVSPEFSGVGFPASQTSAGSQVLPLRRAPLFAIALSVVVALACLLLLLAVVYLRPSESAARVVRFNLDPPAEAEYSFSFALSPDGSKLVFAATSEGKQQLWLRQLDSLQAQPLPGTEEGGFPFWSPDGKSLGFFAAGRLKRIDLDSSTVQTLANVEAGAARGGSWSSSGTIVYAPDVSATLMKVAANGGPATPATAFDTARADKSHRWPCFLPDGRHFLFLEERAGGQMLSAIEVGSLDSATVQPILDVRTDSSVGFANSSLIYSDGTALLAQPFDLGKLAVSDKPVRVAENVSVTGSIGPTGFAPFSASANGLLAYRAGVAVPASELVIVDPSGRLVRKVAPAGAYSQPTLSPDAKKVALEMPDPEMPGASSIWIVDVASGASTRLTFDKFEDTWPVWSKDSQWIYFSSNASGPLNIYRKRADGSGPVERISESSDLEAVSDLSPDGKIVLVSDVGPQTSVDIYSLRLDVPAAQRKLEVYLKTSAAEGDARFSPDGHWVAYRSDMNGAGDWEIFVAPFPPDGSKWQVSTQGGDWPEWSSDGRDLYFASGSALMAAHVIAGNPIRFEQPRKLFAMNHPENFLDQKADYSVFPGGKEFLLRQPISNAKQPPITIVENWPNSLRR